MWAAVHTSWVLRCDVVFQGEQHTMRGYVQRWVVLLEMWTSLYREEGLHIHNNLIRFLQGKSMFPAGVQAPLGIAV